MDCILKALINPVHVHHCLREIASADFIHCFNHSTQKINTLLRPVTKHQHIDIVLIVKIVQVLFAVSHHSTVTFAISDSKAV